jgi:hypothetical protein
MNELLHLVNACPTTDTSFDAYLMCEEKLKTAVSVFKRRSEMIDWVRNSTDFFVYNTRINVRGMNWRDAYVCHLMKRRY